MATFQIAYERLMRVLNRPLTETNVLAGVKDAINDAVLLIQRDHAYQMTEKLARFTYPANSLYVNLGDICQGPLRDLMSVQQVAENGTTQGKPLKVMGYDVLQGVRNRYARTHTAADPYFDLNETLAGFTIEDAYRCDRIGFLVGNNFGLYPTPTEPAYLVLNAHIWLPTLSEPTDTNFLLTYAMDVVQRMALKSMGLYIKNTSDFAPTKEEVESSLLSLTAWDSQIKGNINSEMR